MKRLLLLGAATLMGVSTMMALPTAPFSIPIQNITKISPDGRYIVSEDSGIMTITDLETNHTYVYESYAESDFEEYSSGNGNAWSRNGIMVGNTTVAGTPDYWQNGEWHTLPNPDNRDIFLTGISPDGSMICGVAFALPKDNTPADMMIVPIIWSLGQDGKWNNPEILPFPKTDFSGRANQYVYAHHISEDGKTIFGHTQDYSGTFNFPILYTQDDKGDWSYRMVAEELINPQGLVCPEYPDDSDLEMPDPLSYMTEEQRGDYQEALDAYYASMYDPELYPEYEDYISGDMWAEYLLDCEDYNRRAEIYNSKLMAFFDVFNKISADTPSFVMNQIFMDSAGTKGAMCQKTVVYENPDDMWSPCTEYTNPYVFDFITGEHYAEKIEGYDELSPSQMTSDGTLLAYGGALNATPFIKFPGNEWQPLYDYLLEHTATETQDWMKENLLHTFDFMDYLTGEMGSYENFPMMGRAYASDDFSIFASSIDNSWDFDDEIYSYGYIIPAIAPSSVTLTGADNGLKIKALSGGVISVSGTADVEIFDMQGRRVFSAAGAEGDIATGLDAGFYTVKATSGENSTVVKARF